MLIVFSHLEISLDTSTWNTPNKNPNDQLHSQISKTYRQYRCLPKSLSYWLSGFNEELKKLYSLRFTPKFTTFITISRKKYWDSLYFHGKIFKNVDFDQRYSEFPFQVRKSYVKHCQPEMTKQTCNQHWKKEHGCNSYYFCVTDCLQIKKKKLKMTC